QGQWPARVSPGAGGTGRWLSGLGHLATSLGALAAHLAARLDGLVRPMLLALVGARSARLGAHLAGGACPRTVAGAQPTTHGAQVRGVEAQLRELGVLLFAVAEQVDAMRRAGVAPLHAVGARLHAGGAGRLE